MLCRLLIEPPSDNPTRKEAKPEPPVKSAAGSGLSVNTDEKSSVPRGAAGWNIVNSSVRISVPNFHECLPFTHDRLSRKLKVFWISCDGRKVGLPICEISLKVICGSPPLLLPSGIPGTPPGTPNKSALLLSAFC